MSYSALCDLNSKYDIIKLHDICHNPKCKFQKQNTSTARQFQLDGGSIKKKLKSIFRVTRVPWNKFLKPTLNTLAPVISMAVGAKSNNPQVGQATTYILKSISDGKTLPLTDLNVNGLRLKVM